MTTFNIGSRALELKDLEKVISKGLNISLADESRSRIVRCREYLEKKLKDSEKSYYGINTGFGFLCNVKIQQGDIQQLQKNLVRSHACGTGKPISKEITRLILFLKIQNLCLGYSGVSLELVEQLVRFYNDDILPVIYEYGSLGASGDLAPLAHLSLPLLGEGECWVDERPCSSSELLDKYNLSPIDLKSKEGLALLNGTQFSTAFACQNYLHGMRLFALSNLIGAFSLEAYQADLSPFFPELHKIRSHPGQLRAARQILTYLDHNKTVSRQSVQDPYSFRCIPQVHGATRDTLDFVGSTLQREINSVTDNPNIFVETDQILSGGNFHAQPIAYANDYLSISIAEIASISERRSFNLLNGHRGLPEFLTSSPGLNSGFMIAQYAAASLVSENKQLATPASIDTISSSKGQEDHVSMAANAGTKCFEIVNNVYRVLAIEFMLANQALEFNKPVRMSDALLEIRDHYRRIVPALEQDRVLFTDIEKTVDFIRNLGKQI